MANPNDPNFDPGGVKDRVDTRDYKYEDVIAFAGAPFNWNVSYDIEKEIGVQLPLKDQGDSGSCGGQSWATYNSILEFLLTGTFEERSAKFIYSQVYVPGGGSAGRDCANICVNQGVCRETKLPSYQNSRPPSELFMERSGDITDDIRKDGIPSKLFSYAQVGSDIDAIAQAMQSNHGIVLGIDGSNNGTWLSEFPKPPKGTEKIWRHWVYAGRAKMVNGIKYIGILNSWGRSTGNQGWQWLSEEYFKSHVWSAWTHVIANMPTPKFKHNFTISMEYGRQNNEVRALQQALQVDGEFPSYLPCTGYFGLVTQQAVRDFQKKYRIVDSGKPEVTGYGRVGPQTLQKLNQLFN